MDREQIIKEIEKYQYEDNSKVIELSHQLMEIAKSENDSNLLGVALYYEGDSYYDVDEEKSFQMLLSCLNYLSESESAILLARTNNTLGIICSHREDYTSAINYHIASLEMCKNHKFHYVAGLASANLGFLFQSICLYEKAVDYYHKASEYFGLVEDNPNKDIYIATIETNIFTCNYFLSNKENMLKSIEKLREVREFVNPSFAMDVIEAAFSLNNGDKAGMNSYVQKALDLMKEEEDVADYLDMYQFFARILFENNLMEELGSLLDVMLKKLNKDVFPRIRIEIMKYKLAYCKSIDDMKAYVETAQEYVRLYEKITQTYYKTIGESLDLQIYIKRLMEQERHYRIAAGTDNLTQLLNRNGLDKFATPMIYEAIAQETPITTIIMDVDYFKQYNDYYGHVLGDECLRKVAQVIVNTFTGEIHACRFGGDEFVIICGKMGEADAKALVEQLIENIQGLNIKSVDSPISDIVTVSIGLHVAVPQMGQGIKELIDKADKALYEVKERGRNGYLIK